MGIRLKPGRMLSGGKLVDHRGFRAALHKRFPDAVAGEMEGTGVAAACARRDMPWLMVKGVSDRGDGSKHTRADGGDQDNARQVEAAKTAMALVLRALVEDCLGDLIK